MKKKILIVSPYYLPYVSGMTVYSSRLAEGLSKKKYDVTVFTYRHDHKLSKNELLKGVKIIRIDPKIKFGRGLYSAKFAFKLSKILGKFDVVNIHAPFFEVGYLAALSKLARKKLIITYHCDLSLGDDMLSSLVQCIYYNSVRFAAYLSDSIVMNSFDYAKTSELKGFIRKISQIYPPIEVKRFYKKNSKKLRKKLGIKSPEVAVGFVGRLAKEKGLEYLIKSVPMVKGVKNLKVLIAGEGEKIAGGRRESEKEKLVGLAKKMKLENIIFTGYIPDRELAAFYSLCGVLVLPSISRLESFGMVQVEAMLCGTPVIVTSIKGVSSVVKLTGGGLVVPPRNSKEIANAITKIMKNRKKFVVSRKDLTSHFGIEKLVEGYEKLF